MEVFFFQTCANNESRRMDRLPFDVLTSLSTDSTADFLKVFWFSRSETAANLTGGAFCDAVAVAHIERKTMKLFFQLSPVADTCWWPGRTDTTDTTECYRLSMTTSVLPKNFCGKNRTCNRWSFLRRLCCRVEGWWLFLRRSCCRSEGRWQFLRRKCCRVAERW